MKTDQEPLVSIVIPVCDGPEFLQETIDSALAQTYENIEVIVVSSGVQAEDDTERIVRQQGSRVRYFQRQGLGVAGALNHGITRMRGAYLCWLLPGSLYAPQKIEKELGLLCSVQKNAVAFCAHAIMLEDGARVDTTPLSAQARRHIDCALTMDSSVSIPGCAVLLPKALLDDLGPFDESLDSLFEYEMLTRIATAVPFFHIDEILVTSRPPLAVPVQEARDGADPDDAIRERLLSELSREQIFQYCESSIQKVQAAADVLFNARRWKTWYTLQEKVREYYRENRVEGAKYILEDLLQDAGEENREALTLLQRPKQKKRVLFLASAWITGGVKRVVSKLSGSLCDAFDVIVVCYNKLVEQKAPLDDRAFLLRQSYDGYDTIGKRVVALCALLDVDVLVGTMNYIPEGLKVYDYAEGTRLRTVAYNLGNYFFGYLYPLLTPQIVMEEKGFAKADVAMYLTKNAVNFHAMYYPNGVCFSNFAPAPRAGIIEKKKPKSIFAVGRFNDENKRVDRIFSAFSEVIKAHPDAELVLVGELDLDVHVPKDNPRTLQEQLDALQIPEERIHLEGSVKDIIPYFEQASIFVLTSDAEGLPSVLLEAGAYGVASVSMNIPGLEDVITQGVNGLIVPQDDIQGMADGICWLFENDDARLAIMENAQRMVTRFSFDKLASDWLRLLERLPQLPRSEIPTFLQAEFPVDPLPPALLADQLMHTFDAFVARNPQSGYEWARSLISLPDTVADNEIVPVAEIPIPAMEAFVPALAVPVESFSERVRRDGLKHTVVTAMENKKRLRFVVYFARTIKHEGVGSAARKTYRKLGSVSRRGDRPS